MVQARDHLPLAWFVAGKVFGQARAYWRLTREDLEDMRQEAVLALMNACQGYDAARASWTAYSTTTIRHHLYRWIMHSRLIRLPHRAICAGSGIPKARYEPLPDLCQERPAPLDGLLGQEAAQMLTRLKPALRRTLEQHYGLRGTPWTVQQIAHAEGRTRQAVFARRAQALRELRRLLES